MGDSVFKGGISTFFGICITGFAKSYIFWCFFKFLASIIAYAQFFGMVVMPVMLSLVGPMAPHATVYTPVLAGQREIPEFLGSGHQGSFDRDTMLWKVRYVANLMDLKFSYMVKDVREAQRSLEGSARVAVEDAAAAFEKDGSTEALTAALARVAKLNLAAVADLFDLLMFKYADGYITTITPEGGLQVSAEAYPDWWLKAVGYTQGPPPVPPEPATA